MALLGDRAGDACRGTAAAAPTDGTEGGAAGASGADRPGGRRRTPPGLALAAGGVLLAWGVHLVLPVVPLLTAALVLGILAAHLPGVRPLVVGSGRPGLSFAGKRLMRAGIVLLGLKLGLSDILGLGWQTVAMVLAVVTATFFGTLWLGRRLGLPGDQPLLIATGYSICGASAIGAVSEVRDSDEQDVAASVALVTLCGTLAIAVLPLLHGPLGLGDAQFGRWVGASVHDVGQVVATAQTAGGAALTQAVLVKLMRVMLLAPLVAGVVLAVHGRRGAAAGTEAGAAGGQAAAARAVVRPRLPRHGRAAHHRRAAGRCPRRARRGEGTPARRRPVRAGQRRPPSVAGPHRPACRGARPVLVDRHRGRLLRRRAPDDVTPVRPSDADVRPRPVLSGSHRASCRLSPRRTARTRTPARKADSAASPGAFGRPGSAGRAGRRRVRRRPRLGVVRGHARRCSPDGAALPPSGGTREPCAGFTGRDGRRPARGAGGRTVVVNTAAARR